MVCVTLFVHDKSMATSLGQKRTSVTNFKTRLTYQKSKFGVFQLKKMLFMEGFDVWESPKNRL